MQEWPDVAATIMNSGIIRTVKMDLFTVFSTFYIDQLRKIRWHHWKKRLKISKSAKVKSDTSQESEDIVQQSCEHLHTFVWWGASLTPPPRPPTRKIVAKKRKKIYCQYGLKQHPAGRTSFACLILVYSRTKDCKNRERSNFVAHELQVARIQF